MKCFTDSTGREWRIRLTLGSIDRVLDVAKVDLLEPFAGEPALVTRLRTDTRLLGKVLSELLETDGDRALTSAELRDAFDGETKLSAWGAFSAEWADFFQKDGRGEIGPVLARQDDLIKAASRKAVEKIEAIDLDAALESVASAGK